MRTTKLLCGLSMVLILAVGNSWSGEKQARAMEGVIQLAARPENKVRTLGHEWVWELEQAGIINRRLPKRYRVSLPIVHIGEEESVIVLTYTSPSNSISDRQVMLLLHIPLN